MSLALKQAAEKYYLLSCDAFGVLPPVSTDQRAGDVLFLSAILAKVAGTEAVLSSLRQLFPLLR